MNEKGGLPPGFRFHPTDEELITFYLASKVFNGSFCGIQIAEVDLNRCEPWELPDGAKMGEREWYFFSLRDRKYPTGLRTNRATGAGYWKATGKDREVHSASSGALLGMKKTLVFYRGRAPRGEKTKWVMHEYRLEGEFSCRHTGKEEWVICRIFHKTMDKKLNTHFPEGQSCINMIVPHQHLLDNYNLFETKSILNPNPAPLFFSNQDLIPAKDKAAPVPKQHCKAETDDYNSIILPQFHHHQLFLPDLVASGNDRFHQNDSTNNHQILQNPNFLIFDMGCYYDGVTTSDNLRERPACNCCCSSSSSAMDSALIGSSWPLLDA
ncbi:hypothetical protein CDL15_Pgr007191 [Punica granatum]|nr:hypothetical protein CDL15_Pgr007191 [Punica granatum]